MKKVIYLILIGISTTSLLSWEINTHRAIDKTAIEKSSNFTTFVKNSGIKNKTYSNEKFEDYGSSMTYRDYLMDGEENGISNDNWNQYFPLSMRAQDLIEAGSILEDAQWPHWLSPGWQYDYLGMVDGRFLNHFEDGQTSLGLQESGLQFKSASAWASGGTDIAGRVNKYSYVKALEYFKKGFTETSPTQRRKYQAKMLVSVGHLMHMMNDMGSTAHVRNDSHPEGDPMEVWGRGGENGTEKIGFRVIGNKVTDYAGITENRSDNMIKYGKFSDFITEEAKWTSTHFFSKDTIFHKPLPSSSSTYTTLASNIGGIEKYYIRSRGTSGIPRGTKLAIHVKSYITKGVRERGDTDPESKNWMGFDKSTDFDGDFSVIQENAKILIPRAISNARNFTNYFFRGQISAEIHNHEIIVTNNSDTSLVADKATATLRPYDALNAYKNYRLMYEDDDGTRHPLLFQYDVAKLDGSIAYIGSVEFPPTVDGFYSRISITPNHSIKVPVILSKETRSLIKNKKIIVIFDGNIGSERGVSVCYASNKLLLTATRN